MKTNMRISHSLALLILSLTLAACSGIEVQPTETDTFAAGGYKYYTWRSEPLVNTTNSRDVMYLMDPILRKDVDKELAKKGYVLDPARAQFSVDYIYAQGLRMGERSELATNITTYPSVNPNRMQNQAVVDNAYALGGIKETNNIALQFNDTGTKQEVWQVIITKIVENVNKVDVKEMKKGLREGVRRALEPLPDAK
jgi:hypothetical protein